MAKNATNHPAQEDKNPLDNVMESYEQNKKRINTITTVVLLVVLAGIAYVKLYREPRVEKAATSIAWAQRMFEQDSLDKALNGDMVNPGFLKVQKKYSGTPTGNIANHYIGVCYLHKGEFDNAIKYLKDFDGNGSTLQYVSWGALGDAYMEAGNTDKGIEYYKKASGNKDDEAVTPIYLYRLGVAYEVTGNADEAAKAYKSIKDNYPFSSQAQDIERHLARVGVID